MPRVELKLNLSALDSLRRAAIDAGIETVSELRGEVITAQVMPFDTGDMQNNSTTVYVRLKGDEIHTMLLTDTPYARRLYHHPEYNFQTVNNPNAKGKWLSPWLPGGAKESYLLDTYHLRLRARIGK
jgi:hypothetical protein